MLLPVDESFAKSCGQVRPISLKVTTTEGEKTAKFVINKPFAFIGSNLNCDVCLPMPAVSKRHVYLQLIGGRLYCIDQASREGIFWGERQRLFGWLDEGQSLRVGSYQVMLLERAGTEDCALQQTTHQKPILVEENPDLPQASLQIKETLTFPLQRQLTIIGRSKYCHLELDHDDLSRVHASILRTHDGRYWMVDLMSRTGVKVNGIRCLVSHLCDGDVVKVGTYTTTFKIKQLSGAEIPLGQRTELTTPEPLTVSSPKIEAPTAPPVIAEFSASVPVAIPKDHVVSPANPTVEYPQVPLQQGNLIKSPAGDLINMAEGKSRKMKKRRPVRAALAPPIPEMQLVSTILQQMQQMQQEMFSQMRVSMEIMSNYVEKMQHSQRESVREELTELKELSQELLSLKEKLSKPMLGVRSMVSRQVRMPARIDHVPRRLQTEAPLQNKSAIMEDQERGETLAAEALGLEPTLPQASVANAAPTPEPVIAPAHIWISQRIASLEKERQTRWQKVMAKIMGR